MRVAVLSDIHANLTALDAVLGALGTVDGVWHLGDVVGYGPDPNEVVARLREVGAVGVRGNHDAAALGGPEIEWFNPDARAAMEWTRGVIDDTTRMWLHGLPEVRVEEGVTLVHGSPRDPIWEYVTTLAVARAGMAAMGTAVGLHGHTHVPIAFREAADRLEAVAPAEGSAVELSPGRALVNPGSVGQARDGIPTASWLVLDTVALAATWHRVPYDIASVQARMRAVDLPRRLVERLTYGL